LGAGKQLMATEEYSICKVNGFQVSGKQFYSEIFSTVEEAEAYRKKISETPKIEKTEVRKYGKK